MTILLYDYCELEERASKHLTVWKAWHLVLYAFAAVSGILNYVFLQNTQQLVDNNCVLFPRELAFRTIDLQNATEGNVVNQTYNMTSQHIIYNNATSDTTQNPPDEHLNVVSPTMGSNNLKDIEGRDVTDKNESNKNESVVVDVATETEEVDPGDDRERLVLDTSRTLFAFDSDCQFAEYMPIMSAIFAAAWAVLFTMCPGGGHARTGLSQPWRILAPALLFALVLVGLTGHSFNRTNTGLHAFCSAFYNVTNSTTCSAASPYLERGWNSSWGLEGRTRATRAAAAATWAGWAAAAALLLARCLAAPDFHVKRTTAVLKDPQRKLTPYLKKSRRLKQSPVSPSKCETTSVKSEHSDPTVTTELVTVSIEQDQDTAPPSLQATPVKKGHRPDVIELKSAPTTVKNEIEKLSEN